MHSTYQLLHNPGGKRKYVALLNLRCTESINELIVRPPIGPL